MTAPTLSLAFGLSFGELSDAPGLDRLDQIFLSWLSAQDPKLAAALRQARASRPAERLSESELLLDLARELDAFIGELFGIGEQVSALQDAHSATAPLLRVKYKFVKRQALLGTEAAERESIDAPGLRAHLAELGADPDTESDFAAQVTLWMSQSRAKTDPEQMAAKTALAMARDYAAWAAGTDAGRLRHQRSVLFRHPQASDPFARIEHLETALVQPEQPREQPIKFHRLAAKARHRRDGFALTDPGTDLAGATDQAKYCLLCHKTGKDSCSHGLPATQDAPQGQRFKRSAHGEALQGCPLEERISEFHQLKLDARPIGALAMITLDNPMVAATGHRICNDCMKACIYQQQTPVDIPQAETRVLRDVLELPWGFEIYALLTRWNPLNLQRPTPAAPTGRRVLIVGAGPAGFTLAHYMLNDGHQVSLIDGLKIEPGLATDQPLHSVQSVAESLDQRVAGGFGGVAEYGITNRWDKNFLALIRLILERRRAFSLHGSTRFGGTLGTDEAFAMGFDHIALCTGAGRPNLLDIPNGLATGVRSASDFLMALQLTGAARADSLANLQIELPVLVIGGGLTAMDTATEAQAYYVAQVEKYLRRHEILKPATSDHHEANDDTSDNVDSNPAPDAQTHNRFLAHGRAIRAERERACSSGEKPDFQPLLDAWGGVTVVYRKRLVDAPAYRLNPEEVNSALAEGIRFAEGLSPKRINTDDSGHCSSMTLAGFDAGEQTLAARSIFVAAGTHPNTMIAREEAGNYPTRNDFLVALDQNGQPTKPCAEPKSPDAQVICLRRGDGRLVSFLGDNHPEFAGSVVKALASAKYAAPVISAGLAALPAASASLRPADNLGQLLNARVVSVARLAPGIVEAIIHAPAAARAFSPGQFYRLQNYERTAPLIHTQSEQTRLGMESLALTGAWKDEAAGHIALIVLEMGGSADLVAELQPGQAVALMGPTGAPTEIKAGENVVLSGGGLGNAVLFSIGAAFRAAGSRVVYIAGYKRNTDRFRPADIEAAADQVIWCCDEQPGFTPTRPQDLAFNGNVVGALSALQHRQAFANNPQGNTQSNNVLPLFTLGQADRIITIGSDKMMAAVAQACRTELAPHLKTDAKLIASINSPMQCMMKEICAQCLQRHVDPLSGAVSYVFSCAQQDQPLMSVDFDGLAARLSQNRLLEQQTRRWLQVCRDKSN